MPIIDHQTVIYGRQQQRYPTCSLPTASGACQVGYSQAGNVHQPSQGHVCLHNSRSV